MSDKISTKSINSKESAKRILAYISVCRNLKAYQAVLRSAPDIVIKSICNAAVNAFQGDIVLSPALRRTFSRHRLSFQFLVNATISLSKKRKRIISQCSFKFIPKLLSIVLDQIGNAIYYTK